MFPSQERLRDVFDYDPSGKLIWKLKTCDKVIVGRPVGGMMSTGYLYGSVDRVRTGVHRLVWVWHHGSIPKGMHIDHINRDKLDNRVENLRCVTHGQNLANRDAKGASFSKGKFNAQFRSKHLGRFSTFEEAHAAYVTAREAFVAVGGV